MFFAVIVVTITTIDTSCTITGTIQTCSLPTTILIPQAHNARQQQIESGKDAQQRQIQQCDSCYIMAVVYEGRGDGAAANRNRIFFLVRYTYRQVDGQDRSI